jgi:hypothetical protein
LAYYFTDPMLDQGATAQAFTEEMFDQLKRTNIDVANHFGAAHNLLLNLRQFDKPTYIMKAELQELVTVLDIPEELKQVPDRGIPEWASAIEVYFESSLPPPSPTRRRKPENRANRKGRQEMTTLFLQGRLKRRRRNSQWSLEVLPETSAKQNVNSPVSHA